MRYEFTKLGYSYFAAEEISDDPVLANVAENIGVKEDEFDIEIDKHCDNGYFDFPSRIYHTFRILFPLNIEKEIDELEEQFAEIIKEHLKA